MAKTAVKPSVRRASPKVVEIVEIKPNKEMLETVAAFYINNRDCNDAGTAATKARKKLFALMATAGIAKFPHVMKWGDKKISLNVWIGRKSGTYIDPETVMEEIGIKAFLAICSVSKAALKSAFPDKADRIIALAEKPCQLAENVHVEEVK